MKQQNYGMRSATFRRKSRKWWTGINTLSFDALYPFISTNLSAYLLHLSHPLTLISSTPLPYSLPPPCNDRDEAVASLLAERALNRELTAINSELRANISELG